MGVEYVSVGFEAVALLREVMRAIWSDVEHNDVDAYSFEIFI